MSPRELGKVNVCVFIMIVSNCGGCLTPIGDPPLYLGYLKGVPFTWTLTSLWSSWLLVVGLLLCLFYVLDHTFSRQEKPPEPGKIQPLSLGVSGWSSVLCVMLIVASVFIDPALKHYFGFEGVPVGATFQLLVAVAAYATANRKILEQNQFSFEPVKEVGFLFLGIFLTMVPALGYLSAHGSGWAINTPTAYYFATGILSAILDNAPTYVNFLQLALGPVPIDRATIASLLSTQGGELTLTAISTGAVFFGAMRYIGNGPNFMVRAMAERGGVKMPSFFGYVGYACLLLLPILVINWVVHFVM